TDKYYVVDRIIPRLRKDTDYTIDEKHRSATLTEEGIAKCERLLGVSNLYDPSQIDMLHHVTQALKAHTLFKRDVDYVVKDGEVLIVDEFTGRLMPGRRWSDGLHQAVEAKEGVKIERENQTLATITFQNYFRMYKKLAGMTGTAETEAAEFGKIYNLDVIVIPTNKQLLRVENPDLMSKQECVKKGIAQPLRVAQGKLQVAVDDSKSTVWYYAGSEYVVPTDQWNEALSRYKAQTDTEHDEVTAAGGLFILGTERHEARRIDNQLRGRAGRQGDP